MTLIEALTAFKGRVCGGSEYQWQCFGPNARFIDFSDADALECGSVIHDTKTFEVYELTLCVPGQDQAFRWVNPAHLDAYLKESEAHGIDPNVAWDHVKFTQMDEATALQYASDISDTYYDNLPVPEEYA